MSQHESSVNFRNLIKDLAEMYPYDVCEVVLVELVANALDAQANRISVDFDPKPRILTVSDNGEGMSSHQFDEYHDFAAGLKKRGSGIGFAGVGAKISFNVADRVITETKGRSFSGGSNWHLESHKRLLWEDIKPLHIKGRGTRVEISFAAETNTGFTDSLDIENLLKRHYLPLFDPDFLELYEQLGYYSKKFRFVVNGTEIKPRTVSQQLKLKKTKMTFPTKTRKKIGFGLFGLAPVEYPLGPDFAGILLCTHGKVIKADYFNQFPGQLGAQICGLIEVPEFISFLTTSKTDFIRTRGNHRAFEGLYGPLREEFKLWLKEVGIEHVEVLENQEARKLEAELKKLIDDVPELSDFFGFRTRKPVLQDAHSGSILANPEEGVDTTFPTGEGQGKGEIGPLDQGDMPGTALVRDDASGTRKADPISRKARRGPRVIFVSVTSQKELSWVDGNCITINTSHPAYVRVRTNTLARRVLSIAAVGNAVSKFLASDPQLVDRIMAAWGKK